MILLFSKPTTTLMNTVFEEIKKNGQEIPRGDNPNGWDI